MYVQTSDYNDDQLEESYEQLDKIIFKTPQKHILTVKGDWNAKRKPDSYDYTGTTGCFRLTGTNQRRKRLLEIAKKKA